MLALSIPSFKALSCKFDFRGPSGRHFWAVAQIRGALLGVHVMKDCCMGLHWGPLREIATYIYIYIYIKSRSHLM